MYQKTAIRNSDLFEFFNAGQYASVVDIYENSGVSIDQYNTDDVIYIIYGYCELKKFQEVLVLTDYLIKREYEQKRTWNKENVMLLLVCRSIANRNKRNIINEYVDLWAYEKFGFNDSQVIAQLAQVEAKIITFILNFTNIGCALFVLLTYIFSPAYKYTLYYTLFIALFFTHMLLYALKPNYCRKLFRRVLKNMLKHRPVVNQIQIK